jgi:hypothetical protein
MKVFVVLSLALSACAKRAPSVVNQQLSPDVLLATEVETMSDKAAQLLHRQQEFIWQSWMSGKPPEVGQTYQNTETLFSLESIHRVEKLWQALMTRFQCTLAKDGVRLLCPTREGIEQIRAVTYLHMHFVGEYLSRLLEEQNGAIANLEASLTFNAKGREYPYRDLDRLLANENNAETRHGLYLAATQAERRLAQSIRRKEEKADRLVQELGYPSYQAFGSEMRQVDLSALAKLAEQFLERTQQPYQRVLSVLGARELRPASEKLERSDLFRIFRVRTEVAVSSKELVPRIEKSLAPIGVGLVGVKNLMIDLSDVPAKSSRPLTLALDAPSDVRISLKPGGTLRDQALLLHELGHALPFASVSDLLGKSGTPKPGLLQHPHFELTQLGNRTPNEAFARLFESTFEEPQWFQNQPDVAAEKASQAVFSARARRLFELRRKAGHLLYELQWRQADPQDAPGLYVKIMSRAYGVPLTPDDAARYLVDREEWFQGADELRASFLAEQLRAHLNNQFGPPWWRQPESGNLLRSLWADGNIFLADEVAAQIGEAAVEPKALIRRFETEPLTN